MGGIIIGATVAYLVLMVFGDVKGGTEFPWYTKLLLIPVVVFALWLTIAIHELGHVIAGLSQKFEFRLLSVGPVMVEKELGKLKLKRNTNFNTFGGVALCLPTDQENLNRRFAVFAFGGPLASLIFGGILSICLIYFQLDTSSLAFYLLESLLLISCILSFCIALVTLIPMHSEGFTSDGGRIINLLRGGPSAQIESTLLNAIAQATSGIRPSLINPDPILVALNLPYESPLKPYLSGLLYNHYQDVGELEKASWHLDQYLEGAQYIPKGYVASLYLEKAWFEARHNKNISLAKDYSFREKAGVMVPKSQVLRVEAAIAMGEGNNSLAVKKINEAIKELPKLIDKGAAIAEKEWLEHMLEECRVKN
ncbi:M50 family metallopeptidase [Cecembia rubra]|uniref:M50 family metallopeptidase n=1 Tax=Cecembia rubra TaxID=1485585 RepID=UPI0027147820|nr:M50 family metallopeptidase [Cecembia rubra]